MNTIRVIYKENIKSIFRITNLSAAFIPRQAKLQTNMDKSIFVAIV